MLLRGARAFRFYDLEFGEFGIVAFAAFGLCEAWEFRLQGLRI